MSRRRGLSSAERLPDRHAFSRVFARARSSRDRHFTVLARPGRCPQARLGVIVAKRNAAKATARNRIKRLVRESFRHHKTALAGRDVVVIAKKAAATAPNDVIFDALNRHWNRLVRGKP